MLGAEQVGILRQQPGLNWDRIRETGRRQQSTSLLQALEPHQVAIRVDGITCPSCAILVEHVLLRQPGVMSATLDFTQSIAEISLDAKQVSIEQLQAHIERLGYHASTVTQPEGDALSGAILLRRFLVALIFTVILMMLSVPIWTDYLPFFPRPLRYALMYALFVFTTIVLFYCGWPFLRGAWSSVISRIPTMDLLVTIGSVSAYVYSVVSLFTNQEFLYFDTVGLLITFLLLSRNLEYATRERAQRVIRIVKSMIPTVMRVLKNGVATESNVTDVQPGDHFVLRDGEVAPADARVLSGQAMVDESMLTGESRRIAKATRDLIYAGTRVYTEELVLQVVRASDTLLEQTAHYVRMAQANHAHWNHLADRLVRAFVPFVLTVGVGTWIFFVLLVHMNVSAALLRAIAVLVIGCPCALSIATPLAILGGAQKLSEQGVLLRSPDALERAGQIEVVVFDKTGTITSGRLTVSDYLAKEAFDLLTWVASAEVPAEHPIADAVMRKASDLGLVLRPVSSFAAHTSWGVEATVDGHVLTIGATVSNVLVPPSWQEKIQLWEEAGLTVIYVVMDGELCGAMSFADEVRNDIQQVIRELKKSGMHVEIASGDSETATARMAKMLGIERFHARQTALQKSELIQELQRKGFRVGFVGDGVNDSLALVEADLGIAMGSSPDIALEAGHLVLAQNGVVAIPGTFFTARLTSRVIRQNLIWAIGYNVVAQILAITGLASPGMAALAMVLSSAFVLGNSLRVTGFSPFQYMRRIMMVAAFGVLLWLLALFRI